MISFLRLLRCCVLPALLAWLLPTTSWAQTWQSAFALPTAAGGTSLVRKVLADGAGGCVVLGTFTGTMTLGSFGLTSAGGSDVFVARFNSAGVCTQAVRAGGPNYEQATALALDAAGTAIVLGEFDSPTLSLGSTTLPNASNGVSQPQTTDVFVARLTAAGQWSQAARAGGVDNESAGDVALDPNGSAVVVGTFRGSPATFGTIALSTTATSGSLFVARLSAAGAWTQAVSAQSSGAPHSADCVAVTAAGEAVVAGTFYGAAPSTLTFGAFALTSRATLTLYVARLSRSGTWTQAIQANNPSGSVYPTDLALDAGNNVAVAGNFRNASAVFGPFVLPYNGPTNGQGNDNLFVARLSAAGAWTQAAQASSDNSAATGLVLDASGNGLLSGYFGSPTIGFGPQSLANRTPGSSGQPNTADVFVARLSPAGTWTYAAAAGGAGADYANALALDGNGAWVAGSYGNAPATFGPVTLANGDYTGFVARLGGSALGTARPVPTAVGLVPNPATGIVALHLAPEATARPVLLLDALGRPVHNGWLPARATTATLDLSGLAPGLYVVRCGTAAGRLVVE